MSEYQIKLEAIEEYQHALRYKKMNEELCNSLFGLLGQLSRHYERSGMEIPEEITRIMERAGEALASRATDSELERAADQTAQADRNAGV